MHDTPHLRAEKKPESNEPTRAGVNFLCAWAIENDASCEINELVKALRHSFRLKT